MYHKTKDETAKRDYLYYLSVGHCRLKVTSRKFSVVAVLDFLDQLKNRVLVPLSITVTTLRKLHYEGVSNTITQLRFPGFCFSVTSLLGQWGQICFAEYLKISTFFFGETFCDDSTAIALSCELEHIGASRWNLAPFGPPK